MPKPKFELESCPCINQLQPYRDSSLRQQYEATRLLKWSFGRLLTRSVDVRNVLRSRDSQLLVRSNTTLGAATLRHPNPNSTEIGFFAIKRFRRGRNYGAELMSGIEDMLLDRPGGQEITLSAFAVEGSEGFYEKIGFSRVSPHSNLYTKLLVPSVVHGDVPSV